MSVLACDRYNCGNIMCDTYIPSVGYLCFECQNEFKLKFKKSFVFSDEVIESLKEFINSDKRYTRSEQYIDLDKFFQKYTR